MLLKRQRGGIFSGEKGCSNPLLVTAVGIPLAHAALLDIGTSEGGPTPRKVNRATLLILLCVTA
jgi:hypothetical protein